MVDIPFVREMEFEYGVVDRLSPLVRRVIARNPGPFTMYGTGVYIIGKGDVTVIDPGPKDEVHLKALDQALEGERVSHILVTHTHLDHSPAAAPLKQATGAQTYGYGPHGNHTSKEGVKVEAGADFEFMPDVAIIDGDIIEGDGYEIECVHTPGHTSNHMCFGLKQEKALFSGDHVMGWSTSVITPPDGNMKHYMDSLAHLLFRDDKIYLPTHGPAITEPRRHVEAFIEHRQDREYQITEQLEAGVGDIREMVKVMYAETDKRLHPAAAMSVLAHLHHMVATGRAHCDGEPALTSHFTPA